MVNKFSGLGLQNEVGKKEEEEEEENCFTIPSTKNLTNRLLRTRSSYDVRSFDGPCSPFR